MENQDGRHHAEHVAQAGKRIGDAEGEMLQDVQPQDGGDAERQPAGEEPPVRQLVLEEGPGPTERSRGGEPQFQQHLSPAEENALRDGEDDEFPHSLQKYGIPVTFAKNGRSRRAARQKSGKRNLLLLAKDAAEHAAGDAAEHAAVGSLGLGGLAAAERAAEDAAQAAEEAAAAALEDNQDVVQVHVAVAVLVLDDALEATDDLRDEGDEGAAEHAAEVELRQDVLAEQVACESGDRAGGRVGLAGQEVLDEVDATRLGRRLGQGAEDGVGETAENLVLHIGRNLEIAVGHALGHLLEDDVTEIHKLMVLVFVFRSDKYTKKRKKTGIFRSFFKYTLRGSNPGPAD